MTDKLRWGILSTAAIGTKQVIPAIQAAPNCEVVAIASRRDDLAKDTADQLGIPEAYGSYEKLLAADDKETDGIFAKDGVIEVPIDEVPEGTKILNILTARKLKRDGKTIKARHVLNGKHMVQGEHYDRSYSDFHLTEDERGDRAHVPALAHLPGRVETASKMTKEEMQAVDPTLKKSYQSLVGSLLYKAMVCRPDIAYATGALSRVMDKPTVELMDDAKPLLRYLFGTKDMGIRYLKGDKSLLHGMSDAS